MANRKRREEEGIRSQIVTLFAQAKEVALAHPEKARLAVAKARKLASRKRISLRAYNRVCCRKCDAYFTSETLRVRTRGDHIVYACLSCGYVTRLRKK